MPDIFLSYNREDQSRAKLFAEAFERQGFKVWWDVGLRTGEAYDEVTETALRTAKAVVVLWSKKSAQSRWVRAEATLADRNKTLVPCMIEACERPIMFELTQTAEMGHWQGDASDKAWAAFLADVRRFVAKEEAPAAAAPAAPITAPTVEETLKPGQSGSAPSLAVLPFTNRSGLPADEVFAEGMVEDVISALTQGVNVRVLGATTTASLARTAISDIPALGRQLGVRYLLEGNVRRVGTNLRVTTQLLEAATGAAIWTAKFDRPLSELAELQEELVTDIASNLDTQVYALEMERALKKPSDITAWEAVLRAWSAYRKWDAAARAKGIEEAQRAVAIAPDYAPGHAMLAVTLADAYLVSPDNSAEVQRIRAIADRALSLGPEDAAVLSCIGFALSYVGCPHEGIRHTARAVRKTPGSGLAHYYHGVACTMSNDAEAGLLHLETCVRLSPGWLLLWAVHVWRSMTFGRLGRWAEARTAVLAAIDHTPGISLLELFAGLYSERLGDGTQARTQISTARSSGWSLALAEQFLRRAHLNSPYLETDLAVIRALYAATEPGA